MIRFLFGNGLSKEGVLKAIAADEKITELVRQRATEFVSLLADNAAPRVARYHSQ